jgi:uncharacterized coiled-coil DUF342 family protein
MATKLAQSQLAELPERVGILETKVENINEKVGEVKADIKEMHDCLDRTRDGVMAKLDCMTDEYRTNAAKYYEHADKLNDQQSAQHKELAGKISELEKFKNKGTMYIMILLAFGAGTGWLGHLDIAKILKFVGL